jgi:hypothetical protein
MLMEYLKLQGSNINWILKCLFMSGTSKQHSKFIHSSENLHAAVGINGVKMSFGEHPITE